MAMYEGSFVTRQGQALTTVVGCFPLCLPGLGTCSGLTGSLRPHYPGRGTPYQGPKEDKESGGWQGPHIQLLDCGRYPAGAAAEAAASALGLRALGLALGFSTATM